MERVVLMAYEEILDISPKMFAEAKFLWLGRIVTDIRKENEEL